MRKDCSKQFCDWCKKEVTDIDHLEIELHFSVQFTFKRNYKTLDICKTCFTEITPKQALTEFFS